jgi:two-component system, OmpR family, response regulator
MAATIADPLAVIDVGHIVVVEDDPELRQLLTKYLEENNMPVKSATNRVELNRIINEFAPSVIILDLKLGREDGFDILRELRSHSDVPVVITTGHRPDETDRIIGLELGADDYILKPFGLRELHARIRAVLRRQEMGRTARARGLDRGGYRFSGWRLERRGQRLFRPDDTFVSLSRGEYALLVAFLESPQRALTREQLLQATHTHPDSFDRSIDVQILRLRRKLEIDSSSPSMIQTERGFGYVFARPVEPF